MSSLASRTLIRILAFTAALLFLAASAWPQTGITVVTDQTSYNVGAVVRVRIVAAGELGLAHPLDLSGTLRYAGETQAILHRTLARSFSPSGPAHSTEYRDYWTIPRDASTGRYDISLEALDSASHQPAAQQPENSIASFVVHRKLVEIERISLDKTFYTSGDHVAVQVSLKNASARPFSGLRVEFSKRYWPWTAQTSERAGVDYATLAESLALPAGAEKEVHSARATVAADVKQPTVAQYAVVVWDKAREHVLDIAFTPIVFINPPGVRSPRPYAGPPGYPMQYLHPDLNSINTSAYRRFYPPEQDSPAIEFDTTHTMFAAGSTGSVNFSLRDPTESPWRGVVTSARLTGPQPAELANAQDFANQTLDLDPRGAPVARRAEMRFPGEPGLYHLEIELRDSAGSVLASKSLELGVNPLPKSILIFCAHADDEGAHAGIIRAAVENHIPIHFVYFTNGDAGSCDRYYQHFCGPAEALNFGALRMDEARAALGHVGVPRDDIFFLGLPDGGSGEIWNHVAPSDPYHAVLLAVDHAPYEGIASPNLPYARDSVVQMAKEFIKQFQPEVIYTGHPDERHVDHRTNNWFVVKAMQELLREDEISPDTILLTDQSYGPGPQKHAPYHYAKNVFYVSGEAMALQQEAGWFYQSQGGNTSEGHLRTFDKLRREQVHWRILDWKDHEGWNESR